MTESQLLTRREVVERAGVSDRVFDQLRKQRMVRAARRGPHGVLFYEASVVEEIRAHVATSEDTAPTLRRRVAELEANVRALMAEVAALRIASVLPKRPSGSVPRESLVAALETLVDACANPDHVTSRQARIAAEVSAAADAADWIRVMDAPAAGSRPWIVAIQGLKALNARRPQPIYQLAADRARLAGLEALMRLPREALSHDEVALVG